MPFITRRALLLSSAGPALAGLAALAAPAAHAGYNIFTGEFTVEQAELQARVDTRFPLSFSYAQLFDVRVSHPRLRLGAGTARAAITVDLAVRSAFVAQPLAGTLVISSKLRFDGPTRSIRLVEPDADRIEFQGLAPADSQQLQAIGQVVAQQALQDFAVHTFTAEELTRGNRVFTPGEITVVDGAIKIRLD
jgi:hypothetical protein